MKSIIRYLFTCRIKKAKCVWLATNHYGNCIVIENLNHKKNSNKVVKNQNDIKFLYLSFIQLSCLARNIYLPWERIQRETCLWCRILIDKFFRLLHPQPRHIWLSAFLLVSIGLGLFRRRTIVSWAGPNWSVEQK